jgi:dihydroxyacetone kinase-like protein
MSEATVGVNTLAGKDLARMLEGGLASIEEQTKARIGDKTMMDALIPAVLTLRTSADQNKDISTMLKDAAEAALNGAQATSLIPARYGRAKFQGERTIGYPDPGSISMALVFQGFCNGLEKASRG